MELAQTMIISGLIMTGLNIPQHGERPQAAPVPHVVVHQEDVKEGAQDENSLFSAIREGRYEEAYQLIDSGADVHHIDRASGKSVLALAAEEGHKKLVWKLMSRGADPNRPCPAFFKWAPLFFAVHANKLGAARTLLGNGAEVDARDRDGFTPLMMAVRLHTESNGERDTGMIELLLARKANPTAANKKGYLVPFYAQDQKVKTLLDQADRLRNQRR